MHCKVTSWRDLRPFTCKRRLMGPSARGGGGGAQVNCAAAQPVQAQVVDTCESCAPTEINVPFPVFTDNLTANYEGSVPIRFRQARLRCRRRRRHAGAHPPPSICAQSGADTWSGT